MPASAWRRLWANLVEAPSVLAATARSSGSAGQQGSRVDAAGLALRKADGRATESSCERCVSSPSVTASARVLTLALP